MNRLLSSRSQIKPKESNFEAGSGQRLHKMLQDEKENENSVHYLNMAQSLANKSHKRIRSPGVRGDEVEEAVDRS